MATISVTIPDSVFHGVVEYLKINGIPAPTDDRVVEFIKQDIEAVYTGQNELNGRDFQDAVFEYFKECV